jgi:hypothetical protein
MKELELLLTALAARVYQAKVGGVPLRDAVDFKAWLLQCSRKAAISTDYENFFLEIDK